MSPALPRPWPAIPDRARVRWRGRALLAALLALLPTLACAQPATSEPGAGQPGADQPGADQPRAKQPGAKDPGAKDPGAKDPGPNRPGANPLAAELGRARPVVLLAPDPADPACLALAQALAQPATRAALAERQVVVFTVVAGRASRAGAAIGPAGSAALLAALGRRAGDPARLLLIGKDGGVKLRQRQVSLSAVLVAIDGMPMRRREMAAP